LKRAGVEPEALWRDRRRTPREADLSRIYSLYQQHLEQHEWYDTEGLIWRASDLYRSPRGEVLFHAEMVLVEGFDDFDDTQLEFLEGLASRAARTVVTLPSAPTGRDELFARPRRVIDRWLARQTDPGAFRVVPQPSDQPLPDPRPPGLRWLSAHLFENSRRLLRSPDATGIEILATAGQRAEVEWVAQRVKHLLQAGLDPEEVILVVRDLEDYRDLWLATARSAGLPLFVDSRPRLIESPLVRDLLTWLAVESSDWEFDRLRQALRLPRQSVRQHHPAATTVPPTGAPHKTPTAASPAGDNRSKRAESEGSPTGWRSTAEEGGTPLIDTFETVSMTLECLRRLGLSGGQSLILRRLGGVRSGTTTVAGEEIPPEVPLLLQRLENCLAPLRTAATLGTWGSRLRTLAEQVGALDLPELTPADVEDWHRAVRVIEVAAAIETVVSETPPRLTLGEFVATWSDLLRQERAGQHPPEWGRVRVLTPEGAQTLSPRFLFVMGLGEQAFPRRRGDDCLGAAGERGLTPRSGVAAAGVASSPESPAAGGEDRIAEEMLLFHRLVTAPRDGLVLSYPAVSPGGGPLACSPYLDAVRDLFTPQPPLFQQEDQLSPLPIPGRILGESALRCHAVAQAMAGQGGLFVAAARRPGLKSSLRGVARAARLNVHRFHTAGFTSGEGVLGDAVNCGEVARLYNPQRQYSATQLENYATCPFRFGLDQVLGAQPLDDLEYATDHGERGQVLHTVLARLHAGPLPARRDEESEGSRVARRFLELLEEETLAAQRSADPFLKIIGELEWAQLRDWGEEYGRQWDEWRGQLPAGWDAPLEPRYLESGFGATRSAVGSGGLNRPEPQILRGSSGEVRLAGRIDRIDVGRSNGQTVYAVIDYKSGKRQSLQRADIASGHNLQLPLYALAARGLGEIPADADAVQAILWYLRDGGAVPGLKTAGQRRSKTLSLLSRDDWSEMEALLHEVVPQLVRRLRSGEFPVHNQDPQCPSHCAYHTTCRVAQVRSVAEHLQKTWQLSPLPTPAHRHPAGVLPPTSSGPPVPEPRSGPAAPGSA